MAVCGRRGGDAAVALCAIARPLETEFAKEVGAPLSEAVVQPSPAAAAAAEARLVEVARERGYVGEERGAPAALGEEGRVPLRAQHSGDEGPFRWRLQAPPSPSPAVRSYGGPRASSLPSFLRQCRAAVHTKAKHLPPPPPGPPGP
jgi:hypothetical protein